MSVFSTCINKILNGEDLLFEEASKLMLKTTEGKLSDVEIAAWLVAYKTKQESVTEVLAFVNVLQDKCVPLSIENSTNSIIDTCGTGGDSSNTINISTLSAIVLGSMGYKVVKHGNKSVSSQCGSADILELLGYKIEDDTEQLKNSLLRKNFIFLFAPFFHPAMKYVANVRNILKMKTVFNILGPLINPVRPNLHLLGVSSYYYLNIVGKVLAEQSKKSAIVVFSEDNLDEISPFAKTNYILVHNNNTYEGIIDPDSLPLEGIKSPDEIQIVNLEDAANLSKQILQGKYIPGIETIALNVCACVYLDKIANTKSVQINLQEFLQKEFNDIKNYIISGKVWSYFETLLKE